MKRRWILLMLLLCTKGIFAQTGTYLVEGEDFQVKGGWFVERSGQCTGGGMLRVHGSKTGAPDALTVVDVKKKGRYEVWVRAADYVAQQGTRLFQLEVDHQPMGLSGKHGKEGFFWEKVGTADLEAGQRLLRLKDTKGNFARCDAVFLCDVSEPIDPNARSLKELAAFRIKPLVMPVSAPAVQGISEPLPLSSDAPVIAEISNEWVRLCFVKGGVENKGIAARTEIRIDGRWQALHAFNEDHKVFLLSSEDPNLHFPEFFPAWNSKVNSYFTVNGKPIYFRQSDDLTNPFAAGNLSEALPVHAERVDAHTIVVQYVTMDGSEINGIWSLAEKSRHLSVRLRANPAHAGFYSLGIAAFQSLPPEQVTQVMMPPMFQYRRISQKPVMLTSAMMQQPLAMVESRVGRGFVSTFISADIDRLPMEWGNSTTAPIGFAIKNAANQVQPVAFSPILGQADSKLSAGDILERSFVIGAWPGRWNEALEYVSDHVFRVRDYRKQSVSLTNAVFNMTDLLKQDDASGWDPLLKGFYDIEADPKIAPTVVQTAPLSLLSTALITRDEDFFVKRALPAMEYTLSRRGYRFTPEMPSEKGSRDSLPPMFDPFSSQFTTAYFEGLDALLSKANPWIKDLALPHGEVRRAKGYSVNIPVWVEQLAAYRMTGNGKWLEQAKEGADSFLTRQVYSNTRTPLGKGGFYNASFYAYWWDLLDIYELTKDPKYLAGAEYSAFQTIAGIRSYPLVKDTLQLIHPGSAYTGNTTLWWRGKEKYRLGFPRKPGDAPEKRVEQSTVSPVGLGFEQPFTYFEMGRDVRPVFMSSWAPHLLRLYQFTKRPIFHTYARNAVIGRFANYPGYYATGFTDIPMQTDFPYKGPDVSSIYYHHIAPHLAFTWDYLVTEAIQRSDNKIRFPYTKQEGFVWFTNRVFGQGPGQVFGDEQVRLWMKRGLVKLSSPEVNYLTAISDHTFWVILLNESDKKIAVDVDLGEEVAVGKNGPVRVYSSKDSKPETFSMAQASVQVSIDEKGIRALAVPLTKTEVYKAIPPVKDGMRVIPMKEPWGKLYMYRIRSPFGWDAVYGYLDVAAPAGTTAVVSCNGQSLTRKDTPFEWTFTRLNMSEKITVKVLLTAADGERKEEQVIFDGH